MRSKWVWIALVTITVGLALLCGGRLGVTQAVGEYFWPTTVELMPIPPDCILSEEVPSPETLRIVEYQRSFYQLALQKIVVCRTPHRLPTIEPILLSKCSTRAHAENGCRCTSAVAATSIVGTWR